MDFSYDDEQQALREAVRGLLSKRYGDFEQRRRTVSEDPGFDEELWRQLAEMGVLGLPFAEETGGSGAGPIEVAVVAQELGRVLAPEPFLTSVVLAGGLVAAAGSPEQQAEVLAALSGGERVVALAHQEPGARWGASAVEVTAQDADDGWHLHGVKEPVPYGARADQLLVTAALPQGGRGVFLVDPAAEGVTRVGYPTHDGGRAARIVLDAVPATPLGEATDRTEAIGSALDTAKVIAANQSLGTMETLLAATTDYLKSRKQFGVTLNQFQALTFRAADMYVSLELVRSMAIWAAMVLAEGSAAEASEAACRAALQASRSGRHIGQEAIQLHGGIAMTAEYLVGNATSHLTALEHLLGDGTEQIRLLSPGVGEREELDPLAR